MTSSKLIAASLYLMLFASGAWAADAPPSLTNPNINCASSQAVSLDALLADDKLAKDQYDAERSGTLKTEGMTAQQSQEYSANQLRIAAAVKKAQNLPDYECGPFILTAKVELMKNHDILAAPTGAFYVGERVASWGWASFMPQNMYFIQFVG
jgi:hypothetical protein